MTRLRTLPCACGGFVTADPENPAKGVQRHQLRPEHAAWADREYLSLDPTARLVGVDLSVRARVRPAQREVLVRLGYEV